MKTKVLAAFLCCIFLGAGITYWLTQHTRMQAEDSARNSRTQPSAPNAPSLSDSNGSEVIDRLQSIVIPKIEFDHTSLEEVVDFLRQRSLELESGTDPERKGISMLIKHPGKPGSPATTYPNNAANPGGLDITYSAKDVHLLDAMTEMARQAQLDIYLTDVGIVICQMDDPPFPNAKSGKGDVWRIIYKSGS